MGNPYAPPGESSPPPVAPPGQTAGPGPHHEHARPPAGPPPAGPPPAGPAPRAPEPRDPVPPEVVRATGRRMLHFFLLLLASVLTSALPLPWQVGSLAFVLAAIAVGVRTLVLAWRGGIRGGLLVALGTGVGLAAIVGLLMLAVLAVWPEQMARQRCLADAVTIAATQECEAEFQRALDGRLTGRPAGS